LWWSWWNLRVDDQDTLLDTAFGNNEMKHSHIHTHSDLLKLLAVDGVVVGLLALL
jgi:hypothetical protein